MEKSRDPKLPKEIQGKHTVGRRDLFKGAAAGAAALVGTRAGGSALVRGVAGGAAALVASGAGTALAQGVRSYVLRASAVAWPVGGGMTASAWAYSVDGGPATVPGPILEATERQTLQVTVVNNLPVPTTVHFHGVHPIPNAMDGVPGVTQDPIAPGGSFVYTFTAPSPGTYVYHSHLDTPNQLPRGLYGLLVVRPQTGLQGRGRYVYNREFPLVLGTFPGSIMTPPRAAAVELINGRTFMTLADLVDGRNLFQMRAGDRVLFRVWNASNEVHPMHTHGMHYEVVAADGMDLDARPHRHNLGVNAGEGYDIIARADTPGTWLFHCHDLNHVAMGMIAANVVS